MTDKPKITIGIPAFNEQSNITSLLMDILSQEQDLFTIKKIVVSSDGSTDDTVQTVLSLKSKIITVINNMDRQGQAARQNEILNNCTSDILILLNADIRIPDKKFFNKLIEPIINENVDLTSSSLASTKSSNFFEDTLRIGEIFKNNIFENYKSGINLYTCHGAARAFSKKLYTNFRFKRSVAEDAFSYLFCVSKNYKYRYVKSAIAYYLLPNNFQDHFKRSKRFFDSSDILMQEFDANLVNHNFIIPKKKILSSGFRTFIQHPIKFSFYVLVVISVRIMMIIKNKNQTKDLWDISKSTKSSLAV